MGFSEGVYRSESDFSEFLGGRMLERVHSCLAICWPCYAKSRSSPSVLASSDCNPEMSYNPDQRRTLKTIQISIPETTTASLSPSQDLRIESCHTSPESYADSPSKTTLVSTIFRQTQPLQAENSEMNNPNIPWAQTSHLISSSPQGTSFIGFQ